MDLTEMACVQRFMRLLTTHGNISGKRAPPEVKDFLLDMYHMAEEHAKLRKVHLPPFPPQDYRAFFEPIEPDEHACPYGQLPAAGEVAIGAYTSDSGPWASSLR